MRFRAAPYIRRRNFQLRKLHAKLLVMKFINYFTKKEWGLIGLVGFSYFVNLFLLRGQNALAPIMVNANGISIENGYLISNALGLAIGIFIYGFCGDKYSRANALLISGICHLVVCMFTFSIDLKNPIEWWVYTWRLGTGVMLAGGFGIGLTLIIEILPRSKRLWGSALTTSIGIMGICTYAVISLLFIHEHDQDEGAPLKQMMIVGAVLSLTLTIFQLVYRSELSKGEQTDKEPKNSFSIGVFWSNFFSNQTQWKKLLLLGIICLPTQLCINFIIPALKIGEDNVFINWAYLMYYAVFFISIIVTAYVYDKIQRSSIVVFLGLTIQLIAILLTLTLMVNSDSDKIPVLYLSGAAFLGLSGGLWWLIALIAIENTNAMHRTSAAIFVSNFSRVIIVFMASGTNLKIAADTGPWLLTFAVVGCALTAALFLPKTFSPRLKANDNTDLLPQKVIDKIRNAQKTLYENKDIKTYLNNCAEEFRFSIFESFNTRRFAFYSIADKNQNIIDITRGKAIKDDELDDITDGFPTKSQHDTRAIKDDELDKITDHASHMPQKEKEWNPIRETTILLMNQGKCLSFTKQILGKNKQGHIPGILLYQAPNLFLKPIRHSSLPEGYISFDLEDVLVNKNGVEKLWEVIKSNQVADIVECLDEIAKTAFANADIVQHMENLRGKLELDHSELSNLKRGLLLHKIDALKSKRGYFAYFVAPFYSEQNGIAFLTTNFPAGIEHLRRLTDAVAFVMSGVVELKVKDIAREEVIEQNNHNLSYLLLAINTNLESLSVAAGNEERAYYLQEVKTLFSSIDKRTRLSNILAKAQFKRENLNSYDANIMRMDVIPLARLINETLWNLHDAFKYHSFGKTTEDKNICCLYLKDHLMPYIDIYFAHKNIICVETALQIILQDLLANAIKHSPKAPDININLEDTKIDELPIEFLELHRKFPAEQYRSLSISNRNNTELGLGNYKNIIFQNNLERSSEVSTYGFGIDTIKRIIKFDSLGSEKMPWFFTPKKNCYNEKYTTIFLLIPKKEFYDE